MARELATILINDFADQRHEGIRIKLVLRTLENKYKIQICTVDDDNYDDEMDGLLEDLEVVQMCRYSYMSHVPKNLSWYETTFPKYDDNRFRQLVRRTPIQFETILNAIRSHSVFNGHNSQKQFTVEFQLALVLYRLGSNGDGATIQKMSCLFGIGDGGTIDRITSKHKN